MWMRSYTNQRSSSTTTSPADNNNCACGAIDQFGNPMSMIMSLPADHFLNGRRLRPLIPKPSTSNTIPTIPTCLTQYGSCDTTNNDFFPLNHHMNMTKSHPQFIGVTVGGGRDQFNGHQSVMVSSRWNPTPEQLRALEEMYRCGTRTPSSVQIQHITAQLRRYGKIEGKNVFYWFQNHKARERQKRRRHQLGNASSPNDQKQSQDHHDHQTKEPIIGKTTILSSEHVFNMSGDEGNHNENKGSKTGFEMEQTRGWVEPTNCSTLADQKSVHKLEKAAAECVTDDEWVHFQDQQNSLQNASTIMFQDNAEEHGRRRTSLSLLANNTTWDNNHHSPPTPCIKHTTTLNEAGEYPDDQGNNKATGALTLELFPLRTNGEIDLIKDNDGDNDNGEKETHLASYQFIEFQLLKNSTAY